MDRGRGEGGIAMAFRVGQKVVRVGGRTDHTPFGPPLGVPCTISNIYVDGDFEEMIEIAEYPSPDGEISRQTGQPLQAGFRAKFFRPVIERKTDAGMAILREILERESHQDRVPEKVRQ